MNNVSKYRRRRLIALVVAVGLVFGGAIAFLNKNAIRAGLESVFSSDFAGPGHGSIEFRVRAGATGEEVVRNLVKAGVVENFNTTYKYVLRTNATFFPGTFKLKLQMSTAAAITLLSNATAAQVNVVTIKEGLRINTVLSQLHIATKISLADLQAQATDLASLGIPSGEPSAEGYLFPATYRFDVDASAHQVLKSMVDRTYQELDKFGVAIKDRHKVLTLASIIQKEARQTQDFYKVSRVFTNRLKIAMPLQSDATVSYGSGGTTVTTTDAERANQNGYNTYVHIGLPIGPIGAPGSTAIDAALHPTAGTWLYFCAINLKTGETVFSTTMAQHEVAVAKFRAWINANPGWNG
jgi:UPF0755 protein